MKNPYSYMVDAKVKCDGKETLKILEDLNAASPQTMFVRVPYMKKSIDNPGEFVMEIHPYLLYEILSTEECINNFIEKGALIGYSKDDIGENHYFLPLQLYVNEELFAYISINKSIDNKSFFEIAKDFGWDLDGDFMKISYASLLKNIERKS